ncbi:MAG: PQQ-dependent sugar dehydrogenase [Phycisphaerales bacterium]|nr:PQQ-dependent sugar dehydrogenase [Phycisphaerales bacterium]
MPRRTTILLLALCGAAASSQGQIDNPIPDPITKGSIRIGLEQVATGLAAPNAMTSARDGTGRLFVVDQSGQVRLLKGGQLQATPFLDMSSSLVDLGVFGSHDENDYDERGLLGIAFHPGFSDPRSAGYGKFYTYSSEVYDASRTTFTTSEAPPQGKTFDHQSVVAEWSVDFAHPDQADPGSRRELMRIDQPQFNHNGGMLNFGPDGNLYISLGDGGGADDQDDTPWFDGPTWGHGPNGNAQDITDVHGSMLRIDPLGHNSANGQYGVPADNPFVGQNGVDEIYAYGFRNAFRFNFDRQTGDLIVGDVGQNDIEEVDLVRKGENYGWGSRRARSSSTRTAPARDSCSRTRPGRPGA